MPIFLNNELNKSRHVLMLSSLEGCRTLVTNPGTVSPNRTPDVAVCGIGGRRYFVTNYSPCRRGLGENQPIEKRGVRRARHKVPAQMNRRIEARG
jgi:hypothetical protein